MGSDECLSKLRSAVIGRVAFALSGDVVILPVHHLVLGSEVYFRTSGGSKIEAAAHHEPMGFEVDDHDPATRTGWSVTVSGVGSVVVDDRVIDRLEHQDTNAWAVGDPSLAVWVMLRPDSITGRELVRR
jgi:nitroimidazol reductase NimA-like FMN-containing flavoprotein (pyridoxamine 5'-phosphate oxidase superfamily)